MSPDDETCGYIRDFARTLTDEFNVRVLAPRDQNATVWPNDRFTLQRPTSVLPLRLDPFQGGKDLNRLVEANYVVRFATLVSLASFLFSAIRLSLKADVVCSHWMLPSGLVGALICRLLRKPHIVVEHSGAFHLLTRIRLGRLIARFIVDSSNQIVTVSEDLRTKLINMCPQARHVIDVIRMGVDAPHLSDDQIDELNIHPVAISPFTILFVGRLTGIKGLDILLRATSGLENVRLVIGGEGECRNELEQLARELSVNAKFLGRLNASQRQCLLSECDVVVIPSRILHDGRTEGTPVVCLEAMAAGRVVIASRVGGLPEVITDKQNGFLFAPEDHEELRDKIQTILEDEALRQNVEREAIRSSIEYSWERTGKRYAQLIKRVLNADDIIVGRRIEVSSGNQ